VFSGCRRTIVSSSLVDPLEQALYGFPGDAFQCRVVPPFRRTGRAVIPRRYYLGMARERSWSSFTSNPSRVISLSSVSSPSRHCRVGSRSQFYPHN